ncbi:hypothetical protein ACPXB3_14840 [Gordonia sp. DT219]|uniref:hypothetical protein n=1 Tax=Gordonia sp. DT219 TaxID=3416658 RepID=UPI003CEE48A6
MTWTTTGVAARLGDEPLWAQCRTGSGGAKLFPAEGWLVQTNGAGRTRVVLGYRDGEALVSSDSLRGYVSTIAEDVLVVTARAWALGNEVSE